MFFKSSTLDTGYLFLCACRFSLKWNLYTFYIQDRLVFWQFIVLLFCYAQKYKIGWCKLSIFFSNINEHREHFQFAIKHVKVKIQSNFVFPHTTCKCSILHISVTVALNQYGDSHGYYFLWDTVYTCLACFFHDYLCTVSLFSLLDTKLTRRPFFSEWKTSISVHQVNVLLLLIFTWFKR